MRDLSPQLTAEEAGGGELPDLSGIVLPAPGGSAADVLRARAAHHLLARARGLVSHVHATARPDAARCLDTVGLVLSTLPAYGVIAAFSSPVCYAHLATREVGTDMLRRALGVARFLIGAPDVDSLSLVLPPAAFREDGRLYLPHLHATLDSRGGPVAVQATHEQVRFTWSDGLVVTVPAPGPLAVAGVSHERLVSSPLTAGWAVLNGVHDVMDPTLGLAPAPDPAPPAEAYELLVAGLNLLRDTWPEAWTACRRFYQAVIFQPKPIDHTTSQTFDRLQGTFIASMHDPVQVADALVHEGSHTRMAFVWAIDPLIHDDGATIHVSPWRRDLRPMKGLIDGVHSFANVCLFYQRLIAAFPSVEGADAILAEQRGKVLSAWDYVTPRARPTRIGARVLRELDAVVAQLR